MLRDKIEKTSNIQKNKVQIWYKSQMSMDEIEKKIDIIKRMRIKIKT